MVYKKKQASRKFNKKRATNYKGKRKAAFKPAAKKKQARKRAPFVEIKSITHTQLWEKMGGLGGSAVDTVKDPKILQHMATLNTNIQSNNIPYISRMFPIWSYLNPVNGTGDNEMIGRSLTAKYLTARVHFEFPVNAQFQNPRYYIIHGWVTKPCVLTQFTSPVKTAYTRSLLLEHIADMVVNEFNNDADDEFLDFKERQNKNYKILGYRRIKPKANELQIQPTAHTTATSIVPQTFGSPSDQNHTFKWPLNNRKIRFTTGQSVAPVTTPFLYSNDGDWLPFLMYYCPDTDKIPQVTSNIGEPPVPVTHYPDNQCPKIAYENKFWFSDS